MTRRALKKKPTKPTRHNNVQRSVRVDDGDSLQGLLDKGVPTDATFDFDYGHYDDYHEISLEWYSSETDEEFKFRMDRYKQRLNDYNIWYKENGEWAELEVKRREKEKENKEKQNRAEKKKQLKADIETLKEELKEY